MDQTTLLALIMLNFGKLSPGISDAQALAIAKQLAGEITALVPQPAPAPTP
jgi:hypothetical protein